MKRHSLDDKLYRIIEENIENFKVEDFISSYVFTKNDVSITLYTRELSSMCIPIYISDKIYHKDYTFSVEYSNRIRNLFYGLADKKDDRLDNDLEKINSLIDDLSKDEDTELQES